MSCGRETRAGNGAIGLAVALLIALGLARSGLAQGTLSALQTDVGQVSRAARPSVVTIVARGTVPAHGNVGSRIRTRVGSGVAVSENQILTTASVVEDAQRLWIRTTNGLQVEARIVGFDAIFNLALLQANDVRLPPLKLSTGRASKEGDWAMAIGTSKFSREQITQSVGTIAYRHREPQLPLLQLTNTVYPGYSGGALVNAAGELIGIIQGERGRESEPGASGDFRAGGMSFVLPIETVIPVYLSLQAEGRVRHGYLGVSTRAVSVPSDTQEGLDVPLGAQIESVTAGGPASRAGLKRGDLIVAFERERVEYPTQLARWVAATPPGIDIDLVWVRDNVQHTGKATLTESPEAVPQWAVYDPAPAATAGGGSSTTRIADIERQIQRLNRKLARLKNEGGER